MNLALIERLGHCLRDSKTYSLTTPIVTIPIAVRVVVTRRMSHKILNSAKWCSNLEYIGPASTLIPTESAFHKKMWF